MKDDKENDIEMNDGDSTESPADGNNMHANPESEKKPHNRKVIAAICGLALVALIGGGAYYGIGHQTDADSKAESVQANDSKESGSDASAKDGSKSKEKSHTHDWSITYKTVHHDAVTHTEHVAPVYQNLTTYHTVCNECKQVIDGKADDHIKQTGHSGYSTNVPITDTRKVDAPHADHHEERTHNKLDCRPDRRIHARKHERVRHNPAADKDCTIGLKLPDVLHLEVPSAMGRLGCRPPCCL